MTSSGLRIMYPGGFTLVEVLVTVVIMAIGLLGIAKLHALTIASTSTARLRSLAALEAASLAAAMHTNRAYWAAAGRPPPRITISGSKIVAPDDSALGSHTILCTSQSGHALPICDTTELAAYDVQTWARDLAQLLPNDTGTIECAAPAISAPVPTGAPVTCKIQIAWAEHAVAPNSQSVAQAGAAPAFQTPSYVLYVQP